MKDTRRVLSALRSVIEESLTAGEPVVLHGLGTLRLRRLAPRTIRNIQDFRKMYLGERLTVSFRPSAGLRRRVSESLPQHWKDPGHQAAWRLSEALLGDLELYHAEKVPSGLSGDDDAVRSRCKEAFGKLWPHVLEIYERDVPETVRRQHDHIANTARTRWGA